MGHEGDVDDSEEGQEVVDDQRGHVGGETGGSCHPWGGVIDGDSAKALSLDCRARLMVAVMHQMQDVSVPLDGLWW